MAAPLPSGFVLEDEPVNSLPEGFELEPEKSGIEGLADTLESNRQGANEFLNRVSRGIETGVKDVQSGLFRGLEKTFEPARNPYLEASNQAAEEDIPAVEQKLASKKKEYEALYPKNASLMDTVRAANRDPIGSTDRSLEITALETRLNQAREAAKGRVTEPPLGTLSRAAKEEFRAIPEQKAAIKERYSGVINDYRNDEFWNQVADSLGGSLPSTGATMLNQPLGLAMMYSQTFSQSREEFIKAKEEKGEKWTEEEADEYANTQAAVQTPMELVGDVALAGTMKRSLGALFKHAPGPEKIVQWVKDKAIDLGKSIVGETLLTTPGQSISEDIIAEGAGVRDATTVGQKARKAWEQAKVAFAQSFLMGGGPVAVEGVTKTARGDFARELAKQEAEKEIIDNADRVADETEAYAPESANALRIKARMNAEEAKRKIDEEFDAQEEQEKERITKELEEAAKNQSKVDELLAKSEEEMAQPQPEVQMQEAASELSEATPESEFAPTAEASAVTPEAREPIPEQEAARARVEEALATGQEPNPADVELAGAAIASAQPTTEDGTERPQATSGIDQERGTNANQDQVPGGGVSGGNLDAQVVPGPDTEEIRGQRAGPEGLTDAPTQLEPPLPAGEGEAPESASADQRAITEPVQTVAQDQAIPVQGEPEGGAGTIQSGPKRVQLRSSPQSFEVLEKIPQSEIEKQNNEQFWRVRNERTGEIQEVETGDFAREIKPKSERVRKAVAKLPKAQQGKAEAATEVDSSPDPYQGAPLSSAAPLDLDDNLEMLDELSEYGVLDENATAATVLQKIKDSPKSDGWQKRLATRLLELGMGKLEVQAVYRPDSTWSALFTGDSILFNLARSNPGVDVATLHEAAHDITLSKIRNPEKLAGEAKKAYQDLASIFEQVRNRPEFQGEYGIASAEEMVAEAFSNAGFRRKLDAIKDGPKTLWQKLVNAITRLIYGKPADYNSLLHKTIENAFTLAGAPILQSSSPAALPEQQGTPEFNNWFKNSKVVTENGRPKVVYHGTPTGTFEEFDTYGGKYGLMGSGSYFTESRDIAEEYAYKKSRSKNQVNAIYPVYLSIQNPMDMDAPLNKEKWFSQRQFSQYVPDKGLDEAKTNEDALRVLEEHLSEEIIPDYEGAEIIQDIFRGMGYDGLTHMGGGRVDKNGPKHRVWIAFDPEQIKSAIGNRGTFNPQNPNIAAMAESPEWRDVIGNNNASEEAEAKAFAQMGEEILDETDLTKEDIKPLTPEQRDLLMPTEQFNPIGIANFWAKKFNNIKGSDHSDRVSEAIVGLVQAARTFNPEAGIPFFQWANQVIRNHMSNYARNRKVRNKYVVPDRPKIEDDETETIVSTYPSPEDISIQERDKARMQAIASEALNAVMERTTERDRNILKGYASGQTMREVAAKAGMSPEGVRKVLVRYREAVEKALLIRGITDIQEILDQPTETYGTAEPTRPAKPEDEESFNPNEVGTLEANEIERTSPLPDEEIQDSEEVFAANADDGGTLSQDDSIRSEGSWVPADKSGTDAEDSDTRIFKERATAKNLGPDDAGRARRVLGDGLTQRFTKELESLFGKRVVFIDGLPEGSPSGLFIKSNPKAIYLNVNGKYPLMFLAGHEFGHSLKAENKELYQELQDYVLSNASDWTAYKNDLIEKKGYTEEQAADEFTEDFIGNNFNDQSFWHNLWKSDKSLFEKIADAAILYLRKLLGRVQSMSRDVRPYFENWQQAQDKLIDITNRAKNARTSRELVAPMAERRPSPEAVSEIKKSINSLRRTYVPPAVRPGEAYEIDPKAQSIWAAILDKGQLPASLKDVYDRLGNRINGIRGKVKVYTDDVKRAVEKLHKTKEARDTEYGRIQNALTQEGGMKISDLDESLQGPVWKIRNTIDTLSQAAIDYGIVEGDLADTFRNGIGSYLRRGYAVFDPESGWNYKFLQKKHPQILASARAYLKQKNPESTADQIETTVKDLLDRDTAAGFMLGGKKVLGKSIGSLMERKDIAKPIRDLLGEIKDPLVNLVRSGDFLGQLIAREEMQQEFRNVALKEGLVASKQNSTMTTPLVEDAWIRTVDDDGNPIFRIRANRRYDVLRGLHTTPEFRKAFEMAEKFGDAGSAKRVSDMLLGGFLTASATAKTFATVLNPDSYAPNYIGAIAVEIANGRWKPSTWKDAWAALRSGKNPNAVISAAKQAGIQDARSLYNELIRGGIFDQNITFRDFEATLKNSWLAKLAHHKKSPLEKIGALYSTGDNLGKANAFVDEIATLKKAFPNMPYRELVDQATQLVSDTTPTYSTVPKAFRDISQVGFFLQNFFNFVYSINRVAGYTAYHGIREIRSGNPVLQMRGARRLTGLAMVLAASSYWGAAMLSRAHNDFDEEKDKAFRRSFAAPWDRDANLVYGNTKDGKVTYSNTSYLNPFALITETLNAVVQGKDPAEAAQGAVRTVMGNFFSEGIFLSAILDVARNRKKGTDQAVYNEELDTWAKTMEGANYVIAKALTPKVINKAIRTYKGAVGEGGDYGKTYSAYDEALRLAGYRANTIDLQRNLTYRLYDLNARYRNAEKIERSAANKGRAGDDLQYYTEQSNAAQQRVLNDYKTLLNDAKTLGISEADFIKVMAETKTQREVRSELIQ